MMRMKEVNDLQSLVRELAFDGYWDLSYHKAAARDAANEKRLVKELIAALEQHHGTKIDLEKDVSYCEDDCSLAETADDYLLTRLNSIDPEYHAGGIKEGHRKIALAEQFAAEIGFDIDFDAVKADVEKRREG